MQTPASPIEPWANPAARRVAKCLDQRGVDGVVRYVQGFGRRRLAAYLLGCAAAGFAAATVVIERDLDRVVGDEQDLAAASTGIVSVRAEEVAGQVAISAATSGFDPPRLPSNRVGANRMKADCRWKSLRCCSLMA